MNLHRREQHVKVWYDVYMRVMQDEVRALGRLPALNVPEAFVTRHPFPGERLTNSI